MTYELEFSEKAWREWEKLGAGLRDQFKEKLAERLSKRGLSPGTEQGSPPRDDLLQNVSRWLLVQFQ